MLVPVSLRYGAAAVSMVPQIRPSAFNAKIVLSASARDSMPTPGARTSGFIVAIE